MSRASGIKPAAMRKWSGAKLAKEAAFAEACRDAAPPRSEQWADQVAAEVARRAGK